MFIQGIKPLSNQNTYNCQKPAFGHLPTQARGIARKSSKILTSSIPDIFSKSPIDVEILPNKTILYKVSKTKPTKELKMKCDDDDVNTIDPTENDNNWGFGWESTQYS